MAGGVNPIGMLQGKVDSNNALVVSVDPGSTGIVISVGGTANQVLVSNGGAPATTPVGGNVVVSLSPTLTGIDSLTFSGGQSLVGTTANVTTLTGSLSLSATQARAAILRGSVSMLSWYWDSVGPTDGHNVFLGENAGNFTLARVSAFGEASNNVGVGSNSLMGLTTGYFNTGVGIETLQETTTGYQNAAGGAKTMIHVTTGHDNAGWGDESLSSLTTGSSNSALGGLSLGYTTTADDNTAVGFRAGVSENTPNANVTGTQNTWIGSKSGPNAVTQFNNSTAIGYLAHTTASNQIVLGGTGVTTFMSIAPLWQIGGISSSFPAWKRNGTAINARLADDSDDADVTVKSMSLASTFTLPSNGTMNWGSAAAQGDWKAISDGVWQYRSSAGNGFRVNAITATGVMQVLSVAGADTATVKANALTATGILTTLGGATFHTTSSALTDGAGVSVGTLGTAPAAGNPTKWIGINDNGTTRYIPAW